MKSLFTKKFNNQKVCTFIWNGKPCWIAVQIGTLIGYREVSKSISYCMKKEGFEKGVEYEVLGGADLRVFKSLLDMEDLQLIKKAPKLVIFYEEALYGFLQFTEKPIGVEFRTWIRREVLPQIRKTGSYTLDKLDNIDGLDNLDNLESELLSDVSESDDKLSSDVDNLSYSDFTDVKSSSNMRFSSSYKPSKTSSGGFDLDKFSRFKDVTFNVKIFKQLMDSVNLSDREQLIFLRSLFEESGMDLPFLDV